MDDKFIDNLGSLNQSKTSDPTNPIIKKILSADPNTYIIFFVYECSYCRKALDLLRKSNAKYKGYNINDIRGGMPYLLKVLNDSADLINFNKLHRTKPIIFFNKNFIGGSDDLAKHLKMQ